MKVISAIVCSVATVGACAGVATTASATDVHCDSGEGRDVTIVDGRTACRASVGDFGYARAAAFDGVGYAKATAGARAFGIGAAGGVGASEGTTGLPIAIGVGPDAYAFTSLRAKPDANRIGIAIAMNGSQAQVISDDRTLVCLGSAAFAWDSHSGSACLATPVGSWRTPQPELP